MRTNTRVWLMAGVLGAVVPTGLGAQSTPPIKGTIALLTTDASNNAKTRTVLYSAKQGKTGSAK